MKKITKASVFGAVIASAMSIMPMSAFAWWDTPLVDGGVYVIMNDLSWKAIDVVNHGTYDGAKVIQFDLYWTRNQQWKAVYQGDNYYKFVNINSGKVLEAPGGNYTQGTQLQQWSWNDSFGQKWGLQFEKDNGNVVFYSIHNKMNGLVIDAAGYTKDNGAWIIQWKDIGEVNQNWTFIRV